MYMMWFHPIVLCDSKVYCMDILGKAYFWSLLFLHFPSHTRTEERAAGWYRLSREILKLPDAPSVKDSGSDSKDANPTKPSKDKSSKSRRPQPLIKLVMRRSLLFT